LFFGWTGDTSLERREQVLRHFTVQDIEKGREYALNGFWCRVIFPFVKIAVLLVIVFCGYSLKIGEFTDRLTGGGFWLSSFLFLLIFFGIMTIVSLPFDYYMSFICEHRMGFSNMTSGDWFWRYLKGIMISWPIQATAILIALWVIKTFVNIWPLILPMVITLIGAILMIVFPYLVTPIFYNQTPLEEGPLKAKIQEIAEKAGIPVEGIYQIDESRYSKHTNAYFTGLFSKKRIVLFDTLIKSHTVDEAALIFAHEVGHWLHDHVFKGTLIGFLGGLFGSFALWWIFPYLKAEPAFHLQELWSVKNVPFFSIVSLLLALYCSPFDAQISQYFERQADRTSLELTGLAQTFVDAEIRLARDNRTDLLPHPLRVFWLYSHPPTIDRIAMGLEFQKEISAAKSGQ